jgi:hypothetical protein
VLLIVDVVVKSVGKCVGLMISFEVISGVYCEPLFFVPSFQYAVGVWAGVSGIV